MEISSSMTVVIFALVLAASSLGGATFRPTQVVQTADGPVQGEILSTAWHSVDYASFKGIPYAAPPVNEKRFQPPEPPKPWKETLNTVREGNICIQIDSITNVLNGSEDCLYLNVYSPETNVDEATKLRPVMVWIHGGNFDSGSGNADMYGPDLLIETGVVVVTINYRLGVLGFLSLQNKAIMGNAGLKDQTMALKWVQKNIAKFGGDPNKVTIFGESAGGASIEYHLLSERSAGLFHRSISMSGSPLCPWGYSAPKQGLERASQLASLLGQTKRNTHDLVNFFMNASASDLVRMTEEVVKVLPTFTPTIENTKVASDKEVFLNDCPIKKYMGGWFNKHDHMMGYMNEEALSFVQPLDKLLRMVNHTLNTVNLVTQNALVQSHILDDWFSILDKVTENITEETVRQITKVISEIMFNAPIDLTQRLIHRHSSNSLYYYKILYETPFALHKVYFNISLEGAAHADDVGYIFHIPRLGGPTDPKHSLNVFRAKLVRLFSNFAKYGNPTPQGVKDTDLNVNWGNSGRLGRQLYIDEKLTMHTRIINPQRIFYQNLLKATGPTIQGCKRVFPKILDVI